MSEIIKIEEIISNQPRTLEVKGLGKIKVRDPTKRDRMEATNEAIKMSNWEQLTELEKSVEIQNRVSLKMIIEPKITEEQYLNSSDIKINKVIESISLDYTKRIVEINKDRKRIIQDFLSQLTGVS